MNVDQKIQCEFVIFGCGLAGSTSYYYLSQISKTIVIDTNPKPELRKDRVAKLVCRHTFPYICPKVLESSDIFVRNIENISYASNSDESLINAKQEFQRIPGKMMDLFNYIEWHTNSKNISNFVSESSVLWNSQIRNISMLQNMIVVEILHNGKTINIEAKMGILATGSGGEELQRNLGFQIPNEQNIIQATFSGTEEQIEKNFNQDYIFRVHPQVSRTGPLALYRANNYFNISFIAEETQQEMAQKFVRILQNYKPLQPLIQNLTPNHNQIKPQIMRFGKVWRHPIDQIVKDNLLVIGEAAGFVTGFYYEGTLGAIASAKIASETLKKIAEEHKTYSAANLAPYNDQIKKELLGNYWKSQQGSEDLFYQGLQINMDIWNAYIKTIQKNRKVRDNILQAWEVQEIANYTLQNDDYSGEQIYNNLPLGKRVLLTAHFLKVKFF